MRTKVSVALTLLVFLALFSSVPNAAAYYDPGIQRWLNRDPIEEPGFKLTVRPGLRRENEGPNLYEFVKNRPTREIDAFGLFLGFGYGNWCGWSRSGPGDPIDAVDAACQTHDNCLATWSDACKFKFCNIRFCLEVRGADCHGDEACERARRTILAGCSLLPIIPILIVM